MNIISDQRLGELVGLLGSASDGLSEQLHQFDLQPQTVDEDKAQSDIIDALRELAEARRVVAAVKACEGVRNCPKPCESCRFSELRTYAALDSDLSIARGGS